MSATKNSIQHPLEDGDADRVNVTVDGRGGLHIYVGHDLARRLRYLIILTIVGILLILLSGGPEVCKGLLLRLLNKSP